MFLFEVVTQSVKLIAPWGDCASPGWSLVFVCCFVGAAEALEGGDQLQTGLCVAAVLCQSARRRAGKWNRQHRSGNMEVSLGKCVLGPLFLLAPSAIILL